MTREGASQFPIYGQLGVGIYETYIRWDEIAPTKPTNQRNPADPAYRWPAEIEQAIELARPYRIRVSIEVIGSPPWANGGMPWDYSPNPAEYANFMTAAARRWPSVHLWMVWAEPTKPGKFEPLVPDHERPLRGKGLVAPERYAEMLDDSYGALKSLSRANLVIGGNTYTGGAVSPFHWIAALRLPDGKPPRMDLYGDNPFTVREPRLGGPPLPDGDADFAELPRLASVVDRYLRRDRGAPGPRLFLSEFTLPTDPNWSFNFWVDPPTQAQWIGDALKVARRWQRIYTLGYQGLYDEAPREDRLQVNGGLLEYDGRPRPAFYAYAGG